MMRKATISLLKSCAKDLIEVRAQLPNNLEPSVIDLFESVVQRLEQCETVVSDRAALIALIDDGLQLAGHLGEALLVIAEVVKHYRW
jgi:hypothetical protein